MILVSDKKMLIPSQERFIGHIGDDLSTSKEFLITEFADDGNCIYRLFLSFKNGTSNFFTLDSQVVTTGVKLLWDIQKEHILDSGEVLAQLKVYDSNGEIWHTSIGVFKVLESLEAFENFAVPTEFEQIEEKLNEILLQIDNEILKAPYIGENNNWFIYNSQEDKYIDSLKTSRGAKGDKGDNAVIIDNSITSSKIASNAVTKEKIMYNAVTKEKIANSSVSSDKIEDNAITSSKINNGAVTNYKIADNAITSAKFVDNSVTSSKIFDSAVTTEKVNDNAITSAKIADNAVSCNKIENSSITTDKIADSSITTSKLNQNVKDYILQNCENSVHNVEVSKENSITVTNTESNTIYRLKAYNDGSIAILNSDNVAIVVLNQNGIKEVQNLAEELEITQSNILDNVQSIVENEAEICQLKLDLDCAVTDSYNTISAMTFYKNSDITEVSVPNGVVAIGNSAFCDCTALASLTLPNTLKYVCDNAFNGCTALRYVTLASGFNCSINLSNININVNSLNSIVDSLANRYGQSKLTLNLGVGNISKLSGIKRLIIQQKNWLLI